jgi:D-alanyl-D-alanine carboxypeptidase
MLVRSGVRRVVTAAAAAVVLALLASGCSAGADAAAHALPGSGTNLPDDTREQMENAVKSAMAATGSSGAIAGVWAPWSGSWVSGLGTVAPGDKTPVDADMTFRAGMITRAMTCDALYALAADGTVELSDSVTKYVAGMPKFTDVTLETLCDSTSGIGTYRGLLDDNELGNPQRVWDPRELVGYGVGDVGGQVRPGTEYSESDAGYLLLGLALERASGKSASELLRSTVFEPLGLGDTALPGPTPAEPVVGSSDPLHGFALTARDKDGAFVCDKQTDVTEQSASYGFTDSGVVSDIDDVAAYARALAQGTLVKDKSRFAAPLPVTPTSPSWFTTAGGAIQMGPLIGQYGSSPGYLAAAFSDPTSGLTVAVVLNNSAAGRGAILNLARELAAIGSKAPAASGQKAPAVGLPWTAEEYHALIAKTAICTAKK